MKFAVLLLTALLIGISLPLLAEPVAPAQPVATTTSQPAASAPAEVVVLVLSKKGVDEYMLRNAFDYNDRDIVKPGTFIVVRVPLLGLHAVSTEDLPRLASFTDDRNTDLGNGRKINSSPSDNTKQCILSRDGKSCTFSLFSAALPAADASEIRVKGELLVRSGTGEISATAKDQPLKIGQNFRAGDITLNIESISVDDDRSQSISFTSSQPLEKIKSVEFYDAQGKPIATSLYNDSRSRSSQRLVISLAQVTRVATIKVLLFEKIESVKIPLDMKIKVGI